MQWQRAMSDLYAKRAQARVTRMYMHTRTAHTQLHTCAHTHVRAVSPSPWQVREKHAALLRAYHGRFHRIWGCLLKTGARVCVCVHAP